MACFSDDASDIMYNKMGFPPSVDPTHVIHRLEELEFFYF